MPRLTKEQEDNIRSFDPQYLRTLQISMLLHEILIQHPIDGLDLNPHLQIQFIADNVCKLMQWEKFETVSREEVLMLWLTENILGIRQDRANRDPIL